MLLENIKKTPKPEYASTSLMFGVLILQRTFSRGMAVVNNSFMCILRFRFSEFLNVGIN
jgi:hypothetical protein